MPKKMRAKSILRGYHEMPKTKKYNKKENAKMTDPKLTPKNCRKKGI